MTIAIAIGRLARQDILVKSGAVLERLSRGGSLVLDKTGTPTEGRLKLLDWIGDARLQPLVAQIVYVARPGLAPLVELVEMSRRTMRIIHRNLAVSPAYNLLAGVLAATGVMTPMIAAILMPVRRRPGGVLLGGSPRPVRPSRYTALSRPVR